MKKNICVAALALALLLALAAPRPLRLHVVANSDSVADQSVKLAVRDAVLREMEAFGHAAGAGEARQLVLSHGKALQSAAEAALCQQGLSYGVRLRLGKTQFPQKSYGGTTYPAGTYEALQVVLGEGSGQNWWCVLYPPLCLGSLAPVEQVEYYSLFGQLFSTLFGEVGGKKV